MNSKVLVIGLGGIGSEIVCKLERETDYRKKKNVRFVTMDTDVNTITALKRQGFGGKTITVSDRLTVSEYLARNPDAERWFLKNEILGWKPVSEGAGQVRAVSRLAFEMALKNNKLEELYKAIQELHMSSTDDSELDYSAFRIIIVSTLAGGTGSGMLLPLAIHLRKYMIDNFKRRDVIIRGIFLMPDCMDMVVDSEAEKMSLRSNSYAAIKELDAFMKKAEGYLDGRYPYVTLEPISEERDRPFLSYNYCYLYSATDGNKRELTSFQELKDMLVQCIYAQILGPMQGLNDSIEDNVLKSTMTGAGKQGRAEFNRYCTAGIHILRYPYQEILNYLSIQKLLSIFSEQWMEIDALYAAELERQREREQEGYYAKAIRLDDFYINYVDHSGSGSRLIQQIRQEMTGDTGRQKWEEYLKALDEHIEELYANMRRDWRDEEALCRNTIRSVREQALEAGQMPLTRLGERWDGLAARCEKVRGSSAGGLGTSLFGICEDQNIPKEHFYYWLINDGSLVHMNSVRYFLYQTLRALKEKRKNAEEESIFLKDKLDDVSRIKKVVNERGNIWMPWTRRRFYREICDEYEESLTVLNRYYENWLKSRVYLLGIEKLQRLADMIENFYDQFSKNRMIYQQKKENVVHQLTQNTSRALEYIGTEEKHLEKVSKQVTDFDRDRETNNGLSRVIFRKLWDLSIQERQNRDQKIGEIFQTDCIEFWQDNLKTRYARELDLDIVEAILQEGEELNGESGKYAHLDKVLSQAWQKTTQNLQVQDAESQVQRKKFCTYHSDIFPAGGEARQMLNRQLLQNGGVDGKNEVDKYTLIFYLAVYNLRAVDVVDLEVGQWDEKKNLWRYFAFNMRPDNAGRTFSDYYEVVNIQATTNLTPHIDKNWSNILKMPDLNPSFTRRRTRLIYQAFWYAWLSGGLRYEGKAWKCSEKEPPIEGKMLWDVLDKFSEKECMITNVLKNLIESVSEDTQSGKTFESSNTGGLLKAKSWNLFYIPFKYLREQSAPQWNYQVLQDMLLAIWDMLEMILRQFYESDIRERRFNELILRGYEKLADARGLTDGKLDSEESERAAQACRDGIRGICRNKRNYILQSWLDENDTEYRKQLNENNYDLSE